MKTFLPIVLGLLSPAILACSAQSTETPVTDEGALAASSPHTSSWGYSATLPWRSAKNVVRYPSALPLSGIGAVKVDKAPFRATAMYLGKFEGAHLFAFSEHVGQDRTPRAVELGHIADGKFEVPIESSPLFASMDGDVAVHRAKDGLPREVEERLKKSTPVRWTFEPLDKLMDRHPNARFFVAGRAIHSGALKEAEAKPEIYGAVARQMWADARAEADENLDEREDVSARAGDVLAIAPLQIMAGGQVAPLRDPDGLTIGSDVAAPFLASRPDWMPVSMAATYRSIGRMSGSPILMVDGRDVVAVGVHWTKGVAEDLHPVMRDVDGDPARAFGTVVVRQGADGVAKLALERTAPFAYASSLHRAGEDLKRALPTLGEKDRRVLRALATASEPKAR